MADPIRVLIADASKNYGSGLKAALEKSGVCTVCALVQDGKAALRAVRAEKPQIVLAELILPEMDGLELLDALAQEEVRPRVIILSQWVEEHMICQALQKGAGYFMAKPCSEKALLERICMLMQAVETEEDDADLDAEALIWEEMKKLGVPPACKGFDMACAMLLLAVKDPEVLNAIGERVYRPFLRGENDTVKRIERELRYLIDATWDNGDWEYQQKLFGNTIRKEKLAPTNGTFLAVLSRHVRMELRLQRRERLSGSVNF